MKVNLALIGKDISHSRSQAIYEKLLGVKINYSLIDCATYNDIPDLEELFKKFAGISITSPYKKHFLSLVKKDPLVSHLTSLNCLYKNNNEIMGTNTDYFALKKIIKKIPRSQVVILGDGAVSQVLQNVLKEEKIVFDLYSRSINGPLENLNLEKYSIVINSCARNFSFSGKLSPKAIFWDLNYGKDRFFLCENYWDGMELLEEQAAHALSYWNFRQSHQ